MMTELDETGLAEPVDEVFDERRVEPACKLFSRALPRSDWDAAWCASVA